MSSRHGKTELPQGIISSIIKSKHLLVIFWISNCFFLETFQTVFRYFLQIVQLNRVNESDLKKWNLYPQLDETHLIISYKMFLHVFLWCNLVIRITVDCKQQKRTDKIQNEWWGNTSRQCGGRGGDKVSETVQIFIYAGSSFKLLVFTQVHIFDKTIKIVTQSLSISHRLQKNQTTFWSCIHFCVVTHTHT